MKKRINDWKSFFEKKIRYRGLDYYNSDAVYNLKKTANGYSANVEGSEDYFVKIEVENGEITDLFCTCPYADEGNNCKHMAAVLYAIERDAVDVVNLEYKARENTQELEEIINNAPENEVRQFLILLAKTDNKLRNSITLRFSNSINKEQVEELKRQADGIISRLINSIGYDECDSYDDDEEYIDFEDTADHLRELEEFMYTNISELIEYKCLMPAFELTSYIFDSIRKCDIDNYSNVTEVIARDCRTYWSSIIAKCNEKNKKILFDWFIRYADNCFEDSLRGEFNNVFFNEFQESDFLKRKILYLDRVINNIKSAVDEYSHDEMDEYDWTYRLIKHEYADYVVKRLDIMHKLDYAQNFIDEYIKKYWSLPEIRMSEIERLLREGDKIHAIEIMKESKKIDKNYPNLVSFYSGGLIRLYKDLNKQKQYKEELAFYIFSCGNYDMLSVKQLRDASSEAEWTKYRERILKTPKAYNVKYPLLIEEKMYKRMMEEIEKEYNIEYLNKYEKILKEHFPDRIRDIYVSYVKYMVEPVSNRSKYREIAMYLKKICKYPEGKKIANGIANEWRTKYRRRRGMMEELQKAGF